MEHEGKMTFFINNSSCFGVSGLTCKCFQIKRVGPLARMIYSPWYSCTAVSKDSVKVELAPKKVEMLKIQAAADLVKQV